MNTIESVKKVIRDQPIAGELIETDNSYTFKFKTPIDGIKGVSAHRSMGDLIALCYISRVLRRFKNDANS